MGQGESEGVVLRAVQCYFVRLLAYTLNNRTQEQKKQNITFMKKIAPVILVLFLVACEKNQEATGEIEKIYSAAGSSSVTSMEVTDPSYAIYYPANLPGNHPLIVWGNGTDAQPENYAGIFKHLASWGFVVIDSYSKNTGTGSEILASAEYMVAENADSTSIFHNKIDINKIGAVGHSQGASGVLNAHTDYAGGSIFKTVVTIALPALKVTGPEHKYSTADVTGSLFLLSGTNDGLISPKKSNIEAFDNVSDGVTAAMSMAIGSGHNVIQEEGGKHRGYLTAWLRYRLANDNNARQAFVSEIMANDTWTEVRTQNIN